MYAWYIYNTWKCGTYFSFWIYRVDNINPRSSERVNRYIGVDRSIVLKIWHSHLYKHKTKSGLKRIDYPTPIENTIRFPFKNNFSFQKPWTSYC